MERVIAMARIVYEELKDSYQRSRASSTPQ